MAQEDVSIMPCKGTKKRPKKVIWKPLCSKLTPTHKKQRCQRSVEETTLEQIFITNFLLWKLDYQMKYISSFWWTTKSEMKVSVYHQLPEKILFHNWLCLSTNYCKNVSRLSQIQHPICSKANNITRLQISPVLIVLHTTIITRIDTTQFLHTQKDLN